MSSIYNTEPQPTASAILHTTQGDLSVELFAKQTPLTCRNFLQHCLDGFYDDTIFHRLVPGFILQGGDPTGTGNGGESIYDGGAFSGDFDPWPMDQRKGQNAGPTGSNFRDEFHSRLKFNRRGLLGAANEGTPDSNGSQFFLTLDKTEELTGKNTMFGRIAGDTIYNLAKMGEVEVEDGGERPLYPIRITSVEILINPFEDMVKRVRIAARTAKVTAPSKPTAKRRKVGKQLLSFGDDEGDAVVTPLAKKPKYDVRIVAAGEADSDLPATTKTSKKKKARAAIEEPRPLEGNGGNLSEAAKAAGPPDVAPDVAPTSPKLADAPTRPTAATSAPQTRPELPAPPRKTKLERMNDEIEAVKASMRRNTEVADVKEAKVSARDQMIPETSTRGRKRRPGVTSATEDENAKALDFLKSFQSRLDFLPLEQDVSAPHDVAVQPDDGHGAAPTKDDEIVCDLHFIANCQSCKAWDKAEGDQDSDDEGWMSHTLSFAADKLGKDLSYRKKAEEELIVIDPLAKAQTIRDGKPGDKRSEKSASQARSARLAREAALAGRGAR